MQSFIIRIFNSYLAELYEAKWSDKLMDGFFTGILKLWDILSMFKKYCCCCSCCCVIHSASISVIITLERIIPLTTACISQIRRKEFCDFFFSNFFSIYILAQCPMQIYVLSFRLYGTGSLCSYFFYDIQDLK